MGCSSSTPRVDMGSTVPVSSGRVARPPRPATEIRAMLESDRILESDFFQAMANHTNDELVQAAREFVESSRKDLGEVLRTHLPPYASLLARRCLLSYPDLVLELVRDAITGEELDIAQLCDVILTLTPSEAEAVAQAYDLTYGSPLRYDLNTGVSGDRTWQQLVVRWLTGHRTTRVSIEEDAEILVEELRCNNYEHLFTLLSEAHAEDYCAIATKYFAMKGTSLSRSFETIFRGENLNAVRLAHEFLHSPEDGFAYMLNVALNTSDVAQSERRLTRATCLAFNRYPGAVGLLRRGYSKSLDDFLCPTRATALDHLLMKLWQIDTSPLAPPLIDHGETNPIIDSNPNEVPQPTETTTLIVVDNKDDSIQQEKDLNVSITRLASPTLSSGAAITSPESHVY
ncbi:Alpha-19 giardin [Giardia muris]|uniref:Alpha-19 giardin n=1 Tax=Giardia muris TaxID=5742 RepID=A0A4Z1TAW7_GIAMU|nr:Alpha-19 giardin [Giardia muris]|eukprot:TNJ29661.1 Alpha-19 giardin [Giardia muris]